MSRASDTLAGKRRMDDGIKRGDAIEIVVDGDPVRAYEGESVAAVLLAIGQRTLRTTTRRSAPRGLYCGIGSCFECLMVIEGRPGVRACQTVVREGMRVDTQRGDGQWAFTTQSRSSPGTVMPAIASSATRTNLPTRDPDSSCGCGK